MAKGKSNGTTQESFEQFWKIVSPYITGEVRDEVAIAVLANLILPVLSGAATTYFTGKADGKQGLTAEKILVAVTPLINIALKSSANNLLTSSLANAIKSRLTSQYLDGNMIQLLDFVNATSPVPVILGDSPAFAAKAVQSTVGIAGNTVDLLVMLFVASRLVGTKATLAALGLSAASAALNIKVNQLASSARVESVENDTKAWNGLANVHNNRASINALGGQAHENGKLQDPLQEQKKSIPLTSSVNFLSAIINMGAYFAYPELLRTAASVIYSDSTGKEAIESFSSQSVHVMNAIQSIVAKLNDTDALKVHMESLFKILDAMDQVKEANEASPLKIIYDPEGSSFVLSGISIARPDNRDGIRLKDKVASALADDDACMVKEADLRLETGLVYKLAGESGCGKSTFLKMVNSSWPYASGEITFPCRKEEVYFIPQNTFTPINSSLLECMIYPRSSSELKSVEVEKVKNLIEILKFGGDKEKIDGMKKELDNTSAKKDWNHFSPGEKQMVAVIRMLMSNPEPKVLFMDEATASLDTDRRNIIRELIKERLPKATVIFTDHTPEQAKDKTDAVSFADHTITIDKNDKKLVVSQKDVNPSLAHATVSGVLKQVAGPSLAYYAKG